MTKPMTRVAFEHDEGQDYPVGARVTPHALDATYRTLTVDPSSGDYRVTRCDRIREPGWNALRVSLARAELPTPS
jgi:hypothetical protein